MVNDVYSFSNEELDELSKVYRGHVALQGGNTGREKNPKHWLKFIMFSPPRSGRLYKGFVCNCGYEFYLGFRKES